MKSADSKAGRPGPDLDGLVLRISFFRGEKGPQVLVFFSAACQRPGTRGTGFRTPGTVLSHLTAALEAGVAMVTTAVRKSRLREVKAVKAKELARCCPAGMQRHPASSPCSQGQPTLR